METVEILRSITSTLVPDSKTKTTKTPSSAARWRERPRLRAGAAGPRPTEALTALLGHPKVKFIMRTVEKPRSAAPRSPEGPTPLAIWLARHDNMPIAELARNAGVSYQTTFAVVKGQIKVKRYEVAKKLSQATKGEVPIEALCEG